MAQFEVYRNPNPDSRKDVPYLLDVQSDLLSGLDTRIVVPLITEKIFGPPARQLNPVFVIEETRVVMSTCELAGVRRQEIGRRVASLAGQHDEIVAALDFAFHGY